MCDQSVKEQSGGKSEKSEQCEQCEGVEDVVERVEDEGGRGVGV